MPRLLDHDQELLVVFKLLLAEFKSAATQGRLLYFPPEKFIFPDKIMAEEKKFLRPAKQVKIIYQTGNRDDLDLSEAARLLGVTLYHLVKGESELNNTSYLIDGYRQPLTSQLWPFVRELIQGEIVDLIVLSKLIEKLSLLKLDKTEDENPSGNKETPDTQKNSQTIRDKAAELGIQLDGPYLVEIASLSQGDGEFDVISDYAKEIVVKLKKAGDNRVLGTKIFWFVKFGVSKSSKAVISGLESLGLNSPPMLYGLDVAKAHPNIQKEKDWIALGEADKPVQDGYGDRRVLGFGSNGSQRKLGAGGWSGYWGGNYWFFSSELSLSNLVP